jgi:hypothetical protein
MLLLRLFSLLLVLALSHTAHAEPPLQASFSLNSPVPYQVFQRHGGAADIPVSGSGSGVTGSIEARFNGGAWTSLAPIRSGAFSGVLPAQPQGQGALEIRLAEAPEITFAVPYVGIGDVFIIAGQSNSSGRGTNPQPASHPTLKAGLFGNDYLWRELTDPSDTVTNQADAVSLDYEAGGSVWTLLATHIMNERGIPVAFVPASRGGSSITDWQPVRNPFNRATLYGSMAHRARLTGAKAVLWWQGETDALENMSQADYFIHFTAFAAAIQRDLAIPLVPCLIHNSMGIPDDAEASIRRAVVEASQSQPGILLGPDLSDMASDDPYHLQSDVNLQTAAARWWAAIQGLVE